MRSSLGDGRRATAQEQEDRSTCLRKLSPPADVDVAVLGAGGVACEGDCELELVVGAPSPDDMSMSMMVFRWRFQCVEGEFVVGDGTQSVCREIEVWRLVKWPLPVCDTHQQLSFLGCTAKPERRSGVWA